MPDKTLVLAEEFVRSLPVKQRDKLVDILAGDDGGEAPAIALRSLSTDSLRALGCVTEEVTRNGCKKPDQKPRQKP